MSPVFHRGCLVGEFHFAFCIWQVEQMGASPRSVVKFVASELVFEENIIRVKLSYYRSKKITK